MGDGRRWGRAGEAAREVGAEYKTLYALGGFAKDI
jgi:hypothetical protein